ncbi:MAG: DUF2344 domain-containing protein [Deltaproteobacteria bacterium]|uniref:DUF2344 domain-containing protein n=1 Tax=Candidatus Zymogenus saltonus TaxID=2844893 RepID=A0A9D8PKP6_9DELT|nr:DUF2344 domain-containing protein [Candidatus Zymogenus saltonus]
MKNNKDIETFLASVLPKVSKPGRYIGGEVNSISRNPAMDDLRFALAFPELYEIGMSHKGISIIYGVLNSIHGVHAERVFAPWPDMAEKMRDMDIGVDLFSLETKTPIKDFDVVGFSLMYELTYINVVNMLKLANIPPLSSDRDGSYPLVIAGGAQALNPEPVAGIFDAVVVGDGEEAAVEICEVLKGFRPLKENRKGILSALEKIEGVYVTTFYEPEYKNGKSAEGEGACVFSGMVYTGGGVKAENVAEKVYVDVSGEPGGGRRVRRRILEDVGNGISIGSFHISPVVPNVKAVHDRVSVEIARGCARGCRFCQAGYVNRPVRERSVEEVLSIAKEDLENTGMEELSLLSLSATDHSNITSIIKSLMRALNTDVGERSVALSVPSIRADTLTNDIIGEIKKVRKTGFTIAPEAGSQRLRDAINKNVTEDEIERTVDIVFKAGWNLIKLYFMIGLPTETDRDIEELIGLVRRMARRHISSRKGRINVSISTFIPKPNTPFQWERFIGVEETVRRQGMIRKGLVGEGVKLKFHDPYMSLVEAAFARGGRELMGVVLKASELGCGFDGWTEHFDFGLWERAFHDLGIDIHGYAGAVFDEASPLPWDHIDSGIERGFLIDERDKAYVAETTPDCVRGECVGCGVCGEGISNVFGGDITASPAEAASPEVESVSVGGERLKYLLFFSRSGNVRFLSHLENASLIIRAMKRGGLPLRYSEGFNPKPKVSFRGALPVGVAAAAEPFFVELTRKVDPDEITSRLNGTLPSGIRIRSAVGPVDDARDFVSRIPDPVYRVFHNGAGLDLGDDAGAVSAFLERDEAWYEYKSKGKDKRINIRKYVEGVELLEDGGGIRLKMKTINGSSPSPFKVLSTIFGMPEGETRSLSVVKEGDV